MMKLANCTEFKLSRSLRPIITLVHDVSFRGIIYVPMKSEAVEVKEYTYDEIFFSQI